MKHLCRVCKIHQPENNFYKTSKLGYIDRICIKCKRNKSAQSKRKFKEWAITYKGGKCVCCGYNKCVAALDFHHRDPKQKAFHIHSNRIINTKAKNELDKCDLLCRNCHAEIHWTLSSVGRASDS